MVLLLNGFHPDVQFTHEVEVNETIAFLDVNVKRKIDGSFSTSVYRKKTDTNLYVNWRAFAPKQWKIGTLKGLFRRAFLICSEEEGLNAELFHLKHVFIKTNGYPKKVVHEALSQVKKCIEREAALATQPQAPVTQSGQEANGKATTELLHPYISLPYKGVLGDQILKGLKNMMRKYMPKNVVPRYTFTGKKLGSFFRVKDKIKWGHQTNLVYSYVDEEATYEDNPAEYVGMTNVRLETRVYEHLNTDRNSAVYKHLRRNKKEGLNSDFSVLEGGYEKYLDRRIAEALFAKEKKPYLNGQKKTHKLDLFN